MKLSVISLFFASLLTLQGCALVSSVPSDVAAQVEQLESQQRYGRALELLARVPATHPEFSRLAQKKIRIEAKARLFEQATIRRVAELVGQNHWGEAQEVYREAMEKLPGSEALKADLEEFRRKQAQRLEELKVDQLVGHARFIERALPLQEAIVNTDPGDRGAKRELQRLRADATDVSNELTRIGLAALEKNSLGIAGRTLPIAARLNPDSGAANASEKLSSKEAVQVRDQRQSQEQAIERLRRQQSEQLLAEFRQVFKAGDLPRSRTVMARLLELDGKNPEVVNENSRFKARVDTLVKKHMDDGLSLYGRSRYQAAIDSWSKVLELDPGNDQARSSLERATRIVEKLKQLREKQSPSPKAANSR